MKYRGFQRRLWLALMLCLTCGATLWAQSITVTGVVTDETGGPLPGATVLIQGTTKGVITGIDGDYSIEAPSKESVIEISFVGYQKQAIAVGEQKKIDVQMKPETNELDEVTIVAFGKQKKESVIGAVTTVNTKDLKIPSSNLTTALAGQMAGLISFQRSGEPGRDNAQFFVRGVTTFGTNTNPLILIDGIELTTTDLARLQPDDIATFSIMKDATATALYGARGANGVLLITTKQGRNGPAKVSARVESSLSMPTAEVKIADPIAYMKLYNEASLSRNPLYPQPYSEDKIWGTAAGLDPIYYPANNWTDMLLRDYALSQRANLSVSGGGGVARYYVAASFNHDGGIIKNDPNNNFTNGINNRSYTLRSNINIDFTKTTEVIVRISGSFDDFIGPLQNGEQMYHTIMHSNPTMFPAYFPKTAQTANVKHIMFGNYQNLYTNPYAEMMKGYQNWTRSNMSVQLEGKQDLSMLTEGLNMRVLANISRISQFSVQRAYRPNYYEINAYDFATKDFTVMQTNLGEGSDHLEQSEADSDKITSSAFYLEGSLNYNRTFAEKHTVGGTLVYIMRQETSANTGSLQKSLALRNLGVSGRLTYGYGNRYFAEFNFGYNGSERFAKNHRFGFFPSAGGAWIISNEAFFAPLKKVVSNLKFRYSYGQVGNDQIGDIGDRFFYLSQVNLRDNSDGHLARFGDRIWQSFPTVTVSRYANHDVTWEVSTKQNFALEVGLFNKLNIIAEYYNDYRKNILQTRTDFPSTMGLVDIPRANIGEASGRGVDIQAEYQQNWSTDFWTSARGNFTFARSRFEVYEELDYPGESWRSRIGQSINQTWGYLAERLFIDDAEAANSAVQEISSYPYKGGDIKYRDVNNDLKITEADAVPIGNPTQPEIIYGFGFSMGYKAFDFSFFFQGSANESFWIDAAKTSPFHNQAQLLQAYADNHWSETNQDIYAVWPRLSPTINDNNVPGWTSDANGNVQWNAVKNTWFMRNGSFLRLKQAEIGYSIPGKWKEKMKISSCRIYLNGSNLLLFSGFKLWDVEMAGNGLAYPIQRVFNVGVNVNFN